MQKRELGGIRSELFDDIQGAEVRTHRSPKPQPKAEIPQTCAKYPHIFSPLKLTEKYTMKNRIMCEPMVFGSAVVGNEYGNAAYAPGKYSKLEMPAAGGTAMVSVGEIDINNLDAKRMPLPEVDFTVTEGEAFNAISEYAWRIKRHGAIALHELCHPGSVKPPIPGTEIWGPSAGTTPEGGTIIEIDESMMDSICNDFATAALYMKEAGFDGVCIHAGHGFLFTQFLSNNFNKRIDEYGGSIENRCKFPVRILREMREAVGPDFIIEIRVSGREGTEGGVEIEDTTEFLKRCEGIINAVHISSGTYGGVTSESAVSHGIFGPKGYNIKMVEYVKQHTKGIKVGIIGHITSPEMAEQFLAEGKCDYIVMGRQQIADPEFINKLATGREDEIRQCIGCGKCITFPDPEQNVPFDGIMPWLKVGNCTINPLANLEKTLSEYPKPEAARKVAIIGGGPAGLQAAITAAERGHKVDLYDDHDKAGGTLLFADIDVNKGDISLLTKTLAIEAERKGVTFHFGKKLTPEEVKALGADVVILAIGSHEKRFPIEGLENAVPALDVYQPETQLGKNIVMVGGGLVGTETGLHLANTGHDVTIIEMGIRLAHEGCGRERREMLEHVEAAGIKSHINTLCTRIEKDGVTVKHQDGSVEKIPADTVVFALGMESNPTKEYEDALAGTKVYIIGDCKEVGQIGPAIKDGFNAAMDIL
ncbi:MAG: FAD-dependent oxidoreductase [Lachnospiraceae bacterium]|nr:FAD-dependent oxidoreductase [Lachnospiraceae bacterium]